MISTSVDFRRSGGIVIWDNHDVVLAKDADTFALDVDRGIHVAIVMRAT